jgi:hypothetical protein
MGYRGGGHNTLAAGVFVNNVATVAYMRPEGRLIRLDGVGTKDIFVFSYTLQSVRMNRQR